MRSAVRYGIGGAIGVAIVVFAISSQQGVRVVTTNSPGLLFGSGTVSNPLALTISKGTDFSGTGSAGSPLSIAGALQGFDYGEFGDGSDGVCDFSGGTVLGLSPTSNRYKLDRDIFCSSMTVGATYSINAAAQIFVNGTLQLDGRIDRNGANGVFGSGTPTDAGVTLANNNQNASPRVSVPIEFCGPLLCNTTLGYNATNACASPKASVGGANGADGDDGAFTGCGGGGGATCFQAGNNSTGSNGPSNNAGLHKGVWYLDNADGVLMWESVSTYRAIMQTASGGGIGSSGLHGVGGGQGLGGGWVVVHAREIVGTGSIEAKGGNGTTAANPTATTCPPGGGGGGGGVITVVINKGDLPPTATWTWSVAGGLGATGAMCSSGTCAGLKGGDGGDGVAGLIKHFRVGPQ